MASFNRLFLILSLVFAVIFSILGYSTACSSSSKNELCNFPAKVGGDAAEQRPNTTSGHRTPDTKVTSTPKFWKGPSLPYATLLRHVHGVLNIIGWGTFMPIGIMIARYFKEFPMGCNRWYSAHVVCQTLGYVMGIVGWGFGISIANSSNRSHVPFLVLGIFVIVLSTIQMFAICTKPKKESRWRQRWEMYHHVMGYIIIALIIVDIFEGINTHRHPNKWRWAYVGVLSALGVAAAGLELYKCIKRKLFSHAMKLNANMYTHTTT